jgi:uncharacterized protein YqgV (UPF0045/DUF77 family)
MFLAAQVSIYPLRQPHFAPSINQALQIFREHGLEVNNGATSSVVSGEYEALFSALKEAFQRIAEGGQLVMIVSFSNACPVPR